MAAESGPSRSGAPADRDPSQAETHVWDLWIPDVASLGLSFARGRMSAAAIVWVHAAPSLLRVEVIAEDGRRVGFGDQLARTADTPMTRLRLESGRVTREDRWPGDGDLGEVVILPGGEVGVLTSWWSPGDHREWRWTVEFSNRR